MKKTARIAALAGAALLALSGVTAAADTMLDPFTATELSTGWEQDRRLPSGGVASVAAYGRTDVARLGIDTDAPSTLGAFYLTEGIKTVGAQDFGSAVQVDLYLDPAWDNTAVRAGLWVVGDNGSGQRDELYGIIEFVNNGTHEGFRIWDSTIGWLPNLSTGFTYGQWVTLSITLDTTNGRYVYAVDGVEVGTAAGGNAFIREVFLNSFNFGTQDVAGLEESDYAAHWHAGLVEIDDKDQCRDGAWEAAGFKNQGQCIRFVNTGQDSR